MPGFPCVGFGGSSPGPSACESCDSTSALPSFHFVADHELGRLILLSSDTSGTDLEFTASGITKHRGINTGCGWISHPLASPHMEQLEPSQGAQQEGCSLHT